MLDLIIKNAKVLTINQSFDLLDNTDIGIKAGRIISLAKKINDDSKKRLDAEGALVTPGLIDCHTHLIYGGNRSDEFAMRLNGVSYADIAKAEGGILSTVKATRKASIDELEFQAQKRLDVMMKSGITTLEIKSGYGLDFETEIKMLKVAQVLSSKNEVTIIPTFLGAHTLPLEYKENRNAYINFIIDDVLPYVAKENLAVFVDAFCEYIAFNTKQVERLFKKAKNLGFKLKLHAEQLSDQSGARLAAKMGANSVDHLEYLDEKDVPILKECATTAVLLPGAYYFLNETKKPPIEALRQVGVPMAIATDANPGSSPFLSLPLMMNMACILFGLSIKEAWRGVTINAAQALGLDKEIGSIEINKKADLVIWKTDNENDIIYNPTMDWVDKILIGGKLRK
ncbi:imidazolonepropionase [Thiotrichales bacterium 19S11-10]|nr:imidazolonepropionase [Thiotrichales bacterium 19S11-10]